MKTTQNLHCQIDGTGPDLVLLHPVGLDGTFMGPLLAAASRGHRVVSVDLPGHGRSPAADANAGIDDYVAAVRAVIARSCSGPVVVLGLSFGGMLAQLLALTHPRSVAALVLCGCTGGFAPDVRPLLRERGAAALRGGMAAVVEPTIERWFTPAFRADRRVDAVRARLQGDEPANWNAGWQAISTFDALPRLGEIAVPTLVVAGDCDAATPLAAATALSRAIPGARLAVLEGAPHMMQIERGEAFNDAVAGFLAGLGPHQAG